MIVCGSGDGVLQFFKWGDFGDVCDRFPGHPGSVDSILSTDEPNVIITGAADSKIRIVQLFDHMLRSVVGKHGELPVEDLCWTFNRQAIISSSHENTIKFWDLKGAVEIEDDDESDEDDEEDEEADFSSNEEGEEIEEEEEDDDDDEDEEEESESENEDAKGDKPSRKRDSSDDDSDDDKPRKKSKTKKGMSASKFKFASSQASKSDFFSGF
jgi:cobalamin biosynthesis protein CobT